MSEALGAAAFLRWPVDIDEVMAELEACACGVLGDSTANRIRSKRRAVSPSENLDHD